MKVPMMSQDSPAAISVFELADWRQSDRPHVVLDVREPGEVDICRIEDSLHIPMSQVPARLAELPVDAPLVVMCHHGMRSLRVVNFLRGAGLENAVNLEGGIDAWAAEIDPELNRY
jgi:rhodanese-related sulfurtransferase